MLKILTIGIVQAANALEFTTATNRMYAIDACSNLSSNDWNPVTNHLPGFGTPITFPLNPTHPAAFYRIEVSLP